jgi:predicted nucleotidyltransferase
MREAFRDWVFRDRERCEVLVEKYNVLFNSTRPREYDGSHLVFPGMTPDIELKDYQKNAVAHVLYGNNTLLAHCVGAGKTFEMTAAAMESKRLGLCRKSLFVVPNHLTEQWAGDFLRLYPGANILAATKKDFQPANRKKFCSRIATSDYDAVIIGHALHTFDIDAQVVDVVLVGSRCRGLEHEDSDVDVVIEYYGSEKEDALFNILNEEGLSIGGRNIDMNPITKDKSGTLETYLPEVERYLAEKAQSMEQPSRDMAGDIAKEQEKEEKREKEEVEKERPEKHKTGKFANFSMQKSDDSEKYYLFADIKYPSGDIERHKPIAEFPDKKEAGMFCKSRGITCDDVTDNLENVIRHKKQVASEKGKTSPSRETGRKHGDIGDE